MEKRINKLRKLLLENSDKRVLVLGTIGSGIESLQKVLRMGELYEEVFHHLLIENYGYLDQMYIPKEEQNKIEQSIQIKKGIPMFGHKIMDSDIIVFLYIDPKILRVTWARNKVNVTYDGALNLQNNLMKKLDTLPCHTIKFQLYLKNNGLEKIGRNVYICDSSDHNITDKKILCHDDFYDSDENYFRFPYVKKVQKVEELKRKNGFLLIINETYLDKNDYIDIDKKYRKLFNQFNLVYIITKEQKKQDMFHLNYSNAYFVCEDYFDDYEIMKIYYNYILKQDKTRYSKNKIEMLNKMNKYLKNKKTVKTSELSNIFNIRPRTIERYMNDYNTIYKNIGYDYRKNEWYIIH